MKLKNRCQHDYIVIAALEKMEAKIDDFTKMGSAAMAEQRNLLKSMADKIDNSTIASPEQSTSGSSFHRDVIIDRKISSLWNENGKMCHDIILLENSLKQLLAAKFKTEVALSNLGAENGDILAVVENLQRLLAFKTSEMDEQRESYENKQANQLKNENEILRREMAAMQISHENQLAVVSAKVEKMRDDLADLKAALTSNVTETESHKNQLEEVRAETGVAQAHLNKLHLDLTTLQKTVKTDGTKTAEQIRSQQNQLTKEKATFKQASTDHKKEMSKIWDTLDDLKKKITSRDSKVTELVSKNVASEKTLLEMGLAVETLTFNEDARGHF
jgi:chromosome segregation ATPase